MLNVCRFSSVTLETPKFEDQKRHYTQVVGLKIAEETDARVVLATREGLECMVLERGAASRLKRLAFQVAPGTDLGAQLPALSEKGIVASIVRDPTPAVAEALSVIDPAGIEIHLFAQERFLSVDTKSWGIMPIKIGHVARLVTDVRRCQSFFVDVLGFRVSDWREGTASFLRCGPDHHSANLVYNAKPGIAHIAFEVRDGAELHRACDHLAEYGHKLDWGPSRHNIGHNISAYHPDADGIRVEFYCEMDQMKSEQLGYFEPRPWHSERPQRPRAWAQDTSKNLWGSWGS